MEEDEEIEDTRTLGLSDVLPRKAGVLDPTFSGPRDVERSFTDRGSFVLFFIFIGSVGAIAANAFLFGPGELEKLPLTPYKGFSSITLEWEIQYDFHTYNNIVPHWSDNNGTWGLLDEETGVWTGAVGMVTK